MTLRLWDAEMTVGESVVVSSGSRISAAAGSTARAASSASAAGGTEPTTAARKPSVSGPSCGSSRYAAARSMSAAALTSALSAMPGSAAWPLRPCTSRRNGDDAFSAAAHV